MRMGSFLSPAELLFKNDFSGFEVAALALSIEPVCIRKPLSFEHADEGPYDLKRNAHEAGQGKQKRGRSTIMASGIASRSINLLALLQ